MASQTIGIIVNGATGRIGSTQHLANALDSDHRTKAASRSSGDRLRSAPAAGRAAMPIALPAWRARTRSPDWTTDLDAALSDPALRDLLRCRRNPATRRRPREGNRRRQARLFREAGGADRGARASLAATGAAPRAQARRGRGQGASSRHCRSLPRSRRAARSAASSDSGSNSAGGCSTAATGRASGRAGTIARAAAA